MSQYNEFPIQNIVRYRNHKAESIVSFTETNPDVAEYIKEYFERREGFVPSNYAIGTKVVTA